MPMVRDLVQRLRGQNVLEVLQQGSRVDDELSLADIHGPIRVRKCTN